MKFARLLLILHRADRLTLSTVTYTSIREPGFNLDIALEICLVGIKSKAKAKD